MTKTPLLSVRGVDENKENTLFHENDKEQITFRNKPIAWTEKAEVKTKTIQSKFDNTPEQRYYTGAAHLIAYEGQKYTKEQFLQTYFEEYKKYKYKVRFLHDDIFWLGSSQRAKLQYHILSQQFPLAEVSDSDKKDLEQFAVSRKAETAQKWYSRMKWEKGHEKMITFGAALEVRRTDGTSRVNGTYCYESKIADDTAEYKGVSMSWEQWSELIKQHIAVA